MSGNKRGKNDGRPTFKQIDARVAEIDDREAKIDEEVDAKVEARVSEEMQEMRTEIAEMSARMKAQPMTSREDLENPGQEERPHPDIYDMYDGRCLSLRPSIKKDLEERNLHSEFILDDHQIGLQQYIREGSPWEIYKDAEGKEIRVPASPSDSTQELILAVCDKDTYERMNASVFEKMRRQREGALRLKPNEYIGTESTVFNNGKSTFSR